MHLESRSVEICYQSPIFIGFLVVYERNTSQHNQIPVTTITSWRLETCSHLNILYLVDIWAHRNVIILILKDHT